MFTIKDYDLRDTFGLERKLLLYCGLYPNEGRMKNEFLYHLSACCSIFISLALDFSMAIMLLIHITDISILADSLQLFMATTAFASKLLNLVLSRNQLVEIEKILSEPLFYGQSYTNLRIINYNVSFTKSVGVFFRLLGLGGGVFITFATFSNDLDHITPIIGWNPWGADDKIKCIITHCCHLVGIYLEIYINTTIDILAYMLMTVASSLFEMLGNNLNEIKYDSKDAKDTFERNIRLHYRILRFVDYVENTFSNGIFIQFLASAVVICSAGFQATIISPTSPQFIFVFEYFLSMIFQVAMYCWFGHNIIASSDKLCEAIYTSNWYEADLNLQKSIIIFMERCKKPVIVTAGKFFSLSLVTLISIMKASYSYFAVLQRIYKPE